VSIHPGATAGVSDSPADPEPALSDGEQPSLFSPRGFVAQEWHYSVDGGERQGPISAAELKKLADAGNLKAGDLVWKEGMAEWAPAKSIKGLFTNPAPAAAPAPAAEPARDRPRPEPEEEDRPSPRDRRRDPDEYDRPRRRRDFDDDRDDADRPSGRMRRRDPDDQDESDEDRPRRRRDDDFDEDGDRPRRKRRRAPADAGSKKLTAGLLGILIGWTGAHRFYLGDTTGGLIRILLNLICIAGVIGLIEGIIYLTKSDEEFYETYVVEQKAWF
jgi:TM2 domain-containing membrane protein YozV